MVTEEEIESKLKGNTLRVYWFLLKYPKEKVGPRQVQRALNFSSPGLASYHLERLVELGLVEKKHGEYCLSKVVNVGFLKHFTRVGTFLLPRYLMYATMFTILLLFFITQIRSLNFCSAFALIFGFLATAISWYETIRFWKMKP